MPQDDLSSILPSIHVYPFPPIINISSGRFYLGPKDRNPVASRSAFLECPFCLAVDDFYKMLKTPTFKSFYCKGNLPPEHEHVERDILGREHTRTHRIACAGIEESHFHVKCNICDEIFFLSIPKHKE